MLSAALERSDSGTNEVGTMPSAKIDRMKKTVPPASVRQRCATHQRNAEEWINYYYEPEIAARLAAYVWYICPVKGAQEAMEEIDPSLVDNPLIFPTAETLSATHSFMALEEFQMRAYEGEFADVTGG